MQQETTTRTPAEDLPPSRPGWIRAVAIIGVGALLIGTLYGVWQAVAGSNDPDPIGPGASEPDFSLTDEQAIARFEELDELRVRAYKNADVGMVSNFAGPGQFKDQVLDELQELQREGVTASPIFKTEELTVTSNSADRIQLRQVVIFDARFFDKKGNDVTDESGRERLTVLWQLASTDQGWLISESNIVDAESLQ